ncbi:MAG: PQQ-binding-like beta-propeller repeat protein [Gemmataceae bacterium]|nr:PQQ-binding-like beta-propeller repeat protein [Gemmataceae bacterium]
MSRLVPFAVLLPTLAIAPGPGRSTGGPVTPADQPPPAVPPGGWVVPLGEPMARLGDARFRHVAQIQKVVFRPDGKALAAGGHSSPVVVEWDAATGRELHRYVDPDRPDRQVFLVGYAAGGRRLAVCDYERTVLYDTATGRAVARINTNRTVVLSPNRRHVFGRGPDHRLTAWDAETGEVIRHYPVTPNEPPVFSPDGRWVAVAVGAKPTADPTDPRPPGPQNGLLHDFWAGPVDGSGPGRVLTAPSGTAYGDAAIHWVRDDRLVAVAAGRLAAFDPTTGERLAVAEPPPEGLRVLGAAGGRLYVSRSPGGDAGLDPDTLAEVDRDPPPSLRSDLPPLSPDGSVRAEVRGHSVRLIDRRTGQPVHPDLDRQPTGPPNVFRFSADGRRVLAAGYAGSRVWDVPDAGPAAAAVRRRLTGGYDFTLSPDGRWVAGTDVHGPARRAVAVWDAATGFEEFRVPVEHPGVLGFDPAGRLWAQSGGSVTCYEVPSGREVRAIALPETAVYVHLSPDGRKLAVGGWEVFAVRDTAPDAEWQVIATYPRRQRDCGSARPPSPPLLGFSPDGKYLLTREGVWDVAGRPVKVADGGIPALAVAFSPDGRRMAARYVPNKEGYDGPGNPSEWPNEMRVWDVATRTDVGRVPLPAGVAGWGIDPPGRLWLSHPDTTLTVHPWDWAAFDPK